MASVTLKNLSKIYPGVPAPAVDACSLEIRDREFMVLVGPSGCGKSTTLRMIAGLEEISGGEIFIGERRVNDVAPKDRDIAMVFQNYALYPHMTVYKNMAFSLALRHFPKAEIDRRVREAAEILGITPFLDRKPKALSGGQRQRVAVGRAIVRQPQVFLFDEPLSNLDSLMRVQMRTEIAKLHQRLQATMIYVTHDQTEAMTMGTRICVMKDGVIQQTDEPLKIYDHPANLFVAGFIGSPAMNLIEGEIGSRGSDLFFEAGGAAIRIPERFRAKLAGAPSRRVVLGLRPEHFADEGAFSPRDAKEAYVPIEAKLEVVEPLGAEAYVYFHFAGAALTARLDARARPAAGETRRLLVDAAKAHFFDPQSGAALA